MEQMFDNNEQMWCNLQIKNNIEELPKMEDTLKNIVKRLKPFEYLNSNGLYNALHLRQLSQEIETIHQTASEAHQKNPNKETRKLLNEVCFLRFKTWWTKKLIGYIPKVFLCKALWHQQNYAKTR